MRSELCTASLTEIPSSIDCRWDTQVVSSAAAGSEVIQVLSRFLGRPTVSPGERHLNQDSSPLRRCCDADARLLAFSAARHAAYSGDCQLSLQREQVEIRLRLLEHPREGRARHEAVETGR